MIQAVLTLGVWWAIGAGLMVLVWEAELFRGYELPAGAAVPRRA